MRFSLFIVIQNKIRGVNCSNIQSILKQFNFTSIFTFILFTYNSASNYTYKTIESSCLIWFLFNDIIFWIFHNFGITFDRLFIDVIESFRHLSYLFQLIANVGHYLGRHIVAWIKVQPLHGVSSLQIPFHCIVNCFLYNLHETK